MMSVNAALQYFIIAIATIILAPILGGLLTGIDRKLTARLQHRVGPPILQPFYDIIKLWGKQKMIVNRLQIFFACLYLVFAILALVLFVLQSDMLMIVFIMAIGGSCLILGAMTSASPYSQIGAQREIMQMLAYEPVLLLMVVSIYIETGGFYVSDVLAFDKPLLFSLPLIFIAVGIALTIKMRKSPFDIAASHHAHQEIVRGVLTEYSGPYLAIVEIAHLYEFILILGFIALFWATNIFAAILLVIEMFLLELVIDNITARLTWQIMIKITWYVGIGISIINIAWQLFF